MVVTDRGSTGPIIYIDRSEVHENRWGELKEAIHALVAFVDSHSRRWRRTGSISMRKRIG